MKRRNVCVVNRVIINQASPSVGTQRTNSCRLESTGGIYSLRAAQSANQGTEQKTWTEHWGRTDRCLPASRDYCEAAASSVIVILMMFEEACFISFFFFSFPFIWRGTCVFQWGEEGAWKKQFKIMDLTVCMTHWWALQQHKKTLFSSFLCRGAPAPLTLMIVWETFKIKNNITTKWFIDLNDFYLLIASLCNVGDNVYFSTYLLKSPPVWVRIGAKVVKTSSFCPVFSTLQ